MTSLLILYYLCTILYSVCECHNDTNSTALPFKNSNEHDGVQSWINTTMHAQAPIIIMVLAFIIFITCLCICYCCLNALIKKKHHYSQNNSFEDIEMDRVPTMSQMTSISRVIRGPYRDQFSISNHQNIQSINHSDVLPILHQRPQSVILVKHRSHDLRGLQPQCHKSQSIPVAPFRLPPQLHKSQSVASPFTLPPPPKQPESLPLNTADVDVKSQTSLASYDCVTFDSNRAYHNGNKATSCNSEGLHRITDSRSARLSDVIPPSKSSNSKHNSISPDMNGINVAKKRNETDLSYPLSDFEVMGSPTRI
eukprot:187334_1